MANKTIGGDQPLEDIDVIVPADTAEGSNDADLLAIWDRSANKTKRTTPQALIDAVVKDDIDTIKKDLGGQPYIPFSTYWKILKQGDNGFQSIYDNNSSDYYPTYAEKQIQKIETNLKQVNKDLNNNNAWPQYDTTGASSYMNNALDWLGSLQGRVDTLKSNLKGNGTWPSETGASSYVNNALTWLQSLQARDDDLGNNYLSKWWDRYWAKENSSFPYKSYEKNPPGSGKQEVPPTIKNQDRNLYYFGLQNDGNLVLYRSTSKEGDPTSIKNNRQWIWQTGPEYRPAIFRIKGYYSLGTDSYSSASTTFSLSDTINTASTINENTHVLAAKDGFFQNSDNIDNMNDFSILSIKKIGSGFKNADSEGTKTINSLSAQGSTIFANITKGQEVATTYQGTTYLTPAYLWVDMIIARDSNIPNPENYPNT